jgi:aminopeptidase-like protein
MPLSLTEVPSGQKVFDWFIPDEWNIKDAYLITPDQRKIACFTDNNLHVVNYSVPINTNIGFEELKAHLHTLPDLPGAIPYVTSYYENNWGFCLDYHTYQTLPEHGAYHAFIDSTLAPGSLTYGEAVLEGESDEEILFSTYLCHPSMANNELSGPLITAFLYRELKKLPSLRYTYRFVVAPETIGVIAYLAERGEHLKAKIKAGYVITCAGNPAPFTYKRSRHGNTLADKAAEYVLHETSNGRASVLDFFPYGSDERQYCSPGFDLPVGSIARSMYNTYPQYHSSLDNKEFIDMGTLAESVSMCEQICRVLEADEKYLNQIMMCEPNLGRRGLYPTLGGRNITNQDILSMNWLLNYSDGNHSLLDIARLSRVSIRELKEIAEKLVNAGLLAKINSVASLVGYRTKLPE